MDDDADGVKRRRQARTPAAWACCRLGRMAAAGEADAKAYVAPLLRDALNAGLRRYAERVLADHDEVPEQAQVPRPDPQNEPAVKVMRAGVRMAYWHGGICELHTQWCDGKLAVRFSREVARFGMALPS